ncbi:Myb_DNA-bind_6 domain-containing protein [Cephalotus follicularis]|uniref:Myb_DNA-bind_6 domain-containing protein n=1 Tax=Cephalotus follicularis TaxID=3775 RepID=A0A1Q3BVW6_CEPFO|nr:Myb_DNA-bind_6 domain-containing protein [Cephalotus follicularis]
MEGKREEIRKGPWKAEEDEVLINHVKKYGPRDWSSIRSKGLLQRTGKSCRLRWVNKLRPNLKNGCKFSQEEERVVIELQAQFGNKWAKIATYLPGRTDNDVKNFWSSRQKRLARILQNNSTSSSNSNSKSHKIKREISAVHDPPILEAPKFSSSMEEESSSRAQSCSSSYIDNCEKIKMVALPDLFKPKLFSYDTNLAQLELIPCEETPCTECQIQSPFLQNLPTQPDLKFSPESQELLARMEDPYLFNVFGLADDAELSIEQPFLDPVRLGNEAQLPIGPPYLEPVRSRRNGARDDDGNPVTTDAFFDDIPTDVFDHIEPLPGPSRW